MILALTSWDGMPEGILRIDWMTLRGSESCDVRNIQLAAQILKSMYMEVFRPDSAF
jgi:hypothetical protein